MPIFLFLGLIAFLVGAWFMRRRSTLTRWCRWRLDRRRGDGHFHCVTCGGVCDLPPGREPRFCARLRPGFRPHAAPDGTGLPDAPGSSAPPRHNNP